MLKCNNPSHEHYKPSNFAGLPKGFREVGTAFTNGTELVILGEPPEDDPECLLHNCDEMGCGRNHVIYRFKL